MYRSVLVCCLLFLSISGYSQVDYILDFKEPQTHYVDVTMTIHKWKGGNLEVKLPVWAPGSYLVREFSKNIEGIKANNGNSEIRIKHTSKNSWSILAPKGDIKINYKVYAFELTVRTSFIDIDHAYLNGSSIFLYAEGLQQQKINVTVLPFINWKVISVALNKTNMNNPWVVDADNYDELVDAPFEIGNHVVFSFISSGINHDVAMFGDGNYNIDRLKVDMKKITDQCASVFGSHPCKNYLFIVHNLTSGGGGLEHKNSTTLQSSRWAYGTESSYVGFLNLVAHEYFHLWNVKRLRPQGLGPFDYTKETYTNLLYIAEGFTAYYDDLITKRCGFYNEAQYLNKLGESLSYCTNQPGAAIQPVSESSFDAWIKYYRPNENSANATISYYTKGSVIGAMLDLTLRKETKGKICLDDLMREMYNEFALKLNRGYTDREFIDKASLLAGKNLNSFFEDYVYATKVIPYNDFLSVVGINLIDLNKNSNKVYLGIGISSVQNKVTVTTVERNSPAWISGINVNDELIAIDDYRIIEDYKKNIENKQPNDVVKITISRGGKLRNLDVKLLEDHDVQYMLEAINEVPELYHSNYKKWLNIN